MPNQNTNEPHHVIVTLSDDAFNLLKELAENQDIDLDEAVRRAISTEEFFYSRRKEGCIVLTVKNKKIEEVYFRVPIT